MANWKSFPRHLRRIYRAQRGICPYCGGTLPVERHPKNLQATIDHVVPRSAGGWLSEGNKVLAHARCNTRKDNRMPYPCEVFFARVTAEILKVII